MKKPIDFKQGEAVHAKQTDGTFIYGIVSYVHDDCIDIGWNGIPGLIRHMVDTDGFINLKDAVINPATLK